MHTQPPPLELPEDISATMLEGAQSGINGNVPYHAFTFRDDVKYEGHYFDYDSDEGIFRLFLKKRKTLAQGKRPLTGITIVLDPGHGGEDYGALGPLGSTLAEKDINLINSLMLARRLAAWGAAVHMTRETDIDLSLAQRVDFSLQINPDLFISLHVNSVAETTNASGIRGFTVWYRNQGSAAFAQTILDGMYYVNPTTNRNRNINQANLYVSRPGWTPSVILEAGFIINIDDFVWLIDPAEQRKMADATLNAILDYFS